MLFLLFEYDLDLVPRCQLELLPACLDGLGGPGLLFGAGRDVPGLAGLGASGLIPSELVFEFSSSMVTFCYCCCCWPKFLGRQLFCTGLWVYADSFCRIIGICLGWVCETPGLLLGLFFCSMPVPVMPISLLVSVSTV